jgi:uncharacterized metal-binding protein YceD (DUF177 family)
MHESRSHWPWTVPLALDDIPIDGEMHHLVADAATRAAVAEFADVAEIGRLEADITTVRHGDGFRVTGQVSAAVGQTCVITLEPLQNEVSESIDLLYLRNPPDDGETRDEQEEPGKIGDERIEVLSGRTIDLGAIATEFLMLGIDPYPRKPEAVFAPPEGDTGPSNPFAELAALKRSAGNDGGRR